MYEYEYRWISKKHSVYCSLILSLLVVAVGGVDGDWFKDGVFGDSGSNGATSGWTVSKKMSKEHILAMVIQFTMCSVLKWGFRD